MVTSPPYPMIEMWDEVFSASNPLIGTLLKNKQGNEAYDLMHMELENVWRQFYRVLCSGGIVCINIGDATRKIGESFRLFSNHSKIIQFFQNEGYESLPSIIWRKQTNKPNKFMGSGMYPVNAYITLEHENILIFRKGGNRKFSSVETDYRRKSAFFWEERNNWFSDIWMDIKGTSQTTNSALIRNRSGAFPFELAYRLISMYSIQGDTVCDPFMGTGTTSLASLASMRNSIGFEIDPNFRTVIFSNLHDFDKKANKYIIDRITQHCNYIEKKQNNDEKFKYISKNYGFPVRTSQEKDIEFYLIEKIVPVSENEYSVSYRSYPV